MSLLRRIEKGQDGALEADSKLSELRVRRQPPSATRHTVSTSIPSSSQFHRERPMGRMGCSVEYLPLAENDPPPHFVGQIKPLGDSRRAEFSVKTVHKNMPKLSFKDP